MFQSLFSTSDPNAPNLHPVSSAFQPSELFAPLQQTDLAWTCAGGFVTETQTFYQVLNDGRFLMFQVVHSSTGLWYPTITLNFKLYDAATKEKKWSSLSVNNFVTPPPGQDSRSCKSDAFTIVHRSTSADATHSENYTITAKVSDDITLVLVVSRPNAVSGVKIGQGPGGGFTYFGTNKDKADGYVVHRFWPQTKVTGTLTFANAGGPLEHGARIEEISGVGMLSHAIQGMRPNLIATRWNFCWFSGKLPAAEDRVSAIMMEFTTPESYGRKKGGSGGTTVNVGCLAIGNVVVATAETQWADQAGSTHLGPAVSRATHNDTVSDSDTGYNVPKRLGFSWAGLIPNAAAAGTTVKADLSMDVGFGETSNGLVEKVDVLAEIPKVLKAVVNMAGTKPYIYQWMQPEVELALHGPESLLHGKSEVKVKGTVYTEASYVS